MAMSDPFESIGGGVQLQNGDWVPKGHPLAAQQQPAAGVSAPAPGTAPTTAAPTANTVPGQAQSAQTYSATPGAAPLANTSNQGTQDVVRNSYLTQATQGTKVDANDPAIRQQSDANRANLERSRRQYLAEQAESGSPYATGAMRGQERMTSAAVGQQAGNFEAQLVGRELQNRRSEIQEALQGLSGMISQDQQAALARELAKLDAQLKELGIRSGEGIAGQELGLKDKLGTGGLNIDLMRLLQGGQQFGDQLGFNIADREAHWNNTALQNLLG